LAAPPAAAMIAANRPGTKLMSSPTVLITGASAGIGATYADRFARRGHPLVLVARDAARLAALAETLRAAHGIRAEPLPADLTDPGGLAAVEARLAGDSEIGVLVNNAGAVGAGGFLGTTAAQIEALIALNVTALTRLAAAVAPRFAEAGSGAIVNVGSIVGLMPERPFGIYGATKAYVLALSQTLQAELGPRGVYVQAMLPPATATEIWQRAGRDTSRLPPMMAVDALVDAALLGFDRREPVTIPSLPDWSQWEAHDAARKAMGANLLQPRVSARYR
jgi:short-subunit dehydrogenase